MRLDRREFLRYAPAFASPSPPIWEGIYTDRFTYRSGLDPIQIHASLLDVTSVDVTLTHLDGPTLNFVIGVYTISVDAPPTPEYPDIPTGGAGVYGPAFPVRVSLDTSALEPGLYEISIDPAAMRPENRENLSGSGLVSLNSVSRFVVTVSLPGSYSNLLWVHDSPTGSAYGGFGGESIYGGASSAGVRTVSFHRPGLDRATHQNKWLLRKLKADGYRFEYVDAFEFSLQSPSFTESYDLVIVSGQFEYLNHSFLANLQAHVAAGRNLLLSSNEFAIFRVRNDSLARSMTTYKFDAASLDPVSGHERAGVGMHIPETIWETEFAGLTVWSAHDLGYPPKKDLTIVNPSETGWLFEGTGFNDVMPQAIGWFNAGNRGIASHGGRFDLIDTGLSRTPGDTLAWAIAPSSDARQWENANPGEWPSSWPIDPDGHAICTWRELGNGARVIGLPSQSLMQYSFNQPGFSRLFENIFAYLAQPTRPVPSLGPLGRGIVAGALGVTGAACMRARLRKFSNLPETPLSNRQRWTSNPLEDREECGSPEALIRTESR